MNKKGITLVEVIISVGLISVVMLFLFHILMDMQFEDTHSSYAKENQIQRAAIIKTVQDDFKDFKLKNATLRTVGNTIEIRFEYLEGTEKQKLLLVQEKSISYDGETWNLESENEELKYDISKVKLNLSLSDTCSLMLNVDTNGDGVCDKNCEKKDASGTITIINQDSNYQVCSDYKYIHIVIPVDTGNEENVIDDIEFFYLTQK